MIEINTIILTKILLQIKPRHYNEDVTLNLFDFRGILNERTNLAFVPGKI